jgi:hypothetical protein
MFELGCMKLKKMTISCADVSPTPNGSKKYTKIQAGICSSGADKSLLVLVGLLRLLLGTYIDEVEALEGKKKTSFFQNFSICC